MKKTALSIVLAVVLALTSTIAFADTIIKKADCNQVATCYEVVMDDQGEQWVRVPLKPFTSDSVSHVMTVRAATVALQAAAIEVKTGKRSGYLVGLSPVTEGGYVQASLRGVTAK